MKRNLEGHFLLITAVDYVLVLLDRKRILHHIILLALQKKSMTVKGDIRDPSKEIDEDYYREQYYQHDLDMFEGVPYHHHGIADEFTNLLSLIEVIGESVMSQEKEFKQIYDEEYDPDIVGPSERVIDNWYKKTYRNFSYKAILTVIHGVFEQGLKDLYTILKEAKRITFEIKDDSLLDILKDYKNLDSRLEPLILKVWPYNFIRNKVTHTDGYFTKKDKGFVEFEKFIKNRDDIDVKELKSAKGKFTHRITVKQSTLLKEYIKLIQEIFDTLIKSARNADYIAP